MLYQLLAGGLVSFLNFGIHAVMTGLIGPIMALNGLLLIGWSVAIIFEVMKMAEVHIGRRTRRDR